VINPEPVKTIMDVAAGGTAFGALLGLLPPIAALLSILYTLVRLWETKTVQRFVKRRRKS
jgi:sorbitol-specific phosphotransferase system component IIC